MSIERDAINYTTGTPERNCSLCYQSEQNVARGLYCLMFDCKTSSQGWCGVGIIPERREDVAELGQIDLFDGQGE